jgi:hypothetical protein
MSIVIRKQFKTVEGIRAGIKSVLSRGNKWANDVQAVAVACINHAKEHGDWTLSRELVDGITKVNGVNKSKLGLWFCTFMHADYVENDKGEMMFAFHEGKGVKDIDVEGAYGTNWYDIKPPQKDNSKTLEEVRDAVQKMLATSFKNDKVTEAEGEEVMAVFQRLIEARATAEAQAEMPEVSEVAEAA